MFGNPHVAEEHLVEIGVHRHVDQWPDLNAGRIHPEQQKADSLVFGRIRLGPYQTEYPIGQMSGTGPNFLAIDDPIIAIEHAARAQAGQIAASTRLGIALAPDQVAANRWLDELALLLLGANFQQSRDQHRNTLSAKPGANTGTGELLRNDL